MGLRVSFDLDDDDLKHFRLIMRQARKAAAGSSAEEIVEGASSLLQQVGNNAVPQFVKDRLDKLELMIRMLSDKEWRLPQPEAMRVLNALAYFSEPEDLIPDHVPGLGFLDDAIMIELVVRELRHEIEAYADFCEFRSRAEAGGSRVQGSGSGSAAPTATREDWLESRRQELQSRMRRRRRRNGPLSASRSPQII